MKDVKAFLKTKRETAQYRPVDERVNDYDEVFILRDAHTTSEQGTRCMDCGTPFCHWGCPIGNYIPEWNESAAAEQWEKAYNLLSATNNFPEFTGRVCPAFCEAACVLGVNDDPVTCRENELGIIEKAYESGLVKVKKPAGKSGKKVAVVGSGPAGLAAADQLNRAGHDVTVFEQADRPGGWLRYGIPDFKLDKSVLDRRFKIMEEEGVEFRTKICAGKDISKEELLKKYDAVVLSGGARQPRDLPIKGRGLKGICFAGDYLTQSNQRVAGDKIEGEEIIARDKNVVVIGGGDTGSDCVGTANRQKAAHIYQIEVMPQPPECRQDGACPWPQYPMLLKTTSSHEEGVKREWSILTKEFVGDDKGNVKKLNCIRAEFIDGKLSEVQGSEFEVDADLVLLAVGFTGPVKSGLIDELGLELDQRGNVKTDDAYQTSVKKVFAAGDMRTGQSLVMKCISEGRKAAYHVDKYLMGESELPFM